MGPSTVWSWALATLTFCACGVFGDSRLPETFVEKIETGGEWLFHGPYSIDDQNIVVTLSSSKWEHLYVRKGSKPTKDSYDCLRGEEPQEASRKVCSINGYTGSVYIGVYQTSYYDNGFYTLDIKLRPSKALTISEAYEGESVGGLTWAFYGPYSIKNQNIDVTLSSSEKSPQLYVAKGGWPTKDEILEPGSYDCWKGKNPEGYRKICSFNDYTGTIYIGVYETSNRSPRYDLRVRTRPSKSVSIKESYENEPEMYVDYWSFYGPYSIKNQNLDVTLISSETAHLYVQKGSEPTTSKYDCFAGISPEGRRKVCSINDYTGTIYVGVRQTSIYQIESYDVVVETRPSKPLNISNTYEDEPPISKGEWAFYGPYSICKDNLDVTLTGSSDAHLYVKTGSQPTLSSYTCREGADQRSARKTCSIEDFTGTVYIGVYGGEFSSDAFDLLVQSRQPAGYVVPPECVPSDGSGVRRLEGTATMFCALVLGRMFW